MKEKPRLVGDFNFTENNSYFAKSNTYDNKKNEHK